MSFEKYKVTIGISFFNAEDTLSAAIKSVYAQTFNDWELLLIDDGSTDGSMRIVEKLNDSRIRVVSDGVNMRLAARLNQISHLAQGEYLARMDADDMMHPDRIRQQVEYLDAHQSVDLVGTSMCRIDAASRVQGVRRSQQPITDPSQSIKHGVLSHATVVGRTQWFCSNQYDESLPRAQDRELWCRCLLQDRLCYANLDSPLYFVREDSGASMCKRILSSYPVDRKIIFTYGPTHLGWSSTLYEVMKSYCKQLAWKSALLVSVADLLLSTRNSIISIEEEIKFQRVIDDILLVDFPLHQNAA